MILRSEVPADYNQIALVNYRAFSNWRPENFNVDEHVMVALARQLADFDPELSIVAEENGRIVGHVMLVPVDAIVQGSLRSGVMLGPVAVLPEHQNTGIGKQLIAKSHDTASGKGYLFSLLCGHPSYYPRFGYRQNTFSIAGTKARFDASGIDTEGIEEKPVSPDDIPKLREIQISQASEHAFSFIKHNDFIDWCSHTPSFRAFTMLKDGHVAAYARFNKNQPSDLREFYAAKGFMAHALAYIVNTYIKDDSELSLHIPADIVQRELGDRAEIQDMRHASDAFMICPLNDDKAVAGYCEAVRSGKTKPGIVCYPAWIDMA